MASPRNQHCANCIGTLSFPIISRPVQEAKALLVNAQSTERQYLLIVVTTQRPQLQRRHRYSAQTSQS